MLPRSLRLALIALAVAALVPFAFLFKARYTHSPLPRVHPIQGMDNQPKYKAQRANPVFADGRAERPPVAGTVARGQLRNDDRFYRGLENGQWVASIPVEVNASLLHRGQERYGIYCSPCHGLSGYGDGIVGVRADRLQEGTWVPPANLHDDQVRQRPDGHLFNTITNGIRTMSAYGPIIPEHDRWAIVAYVRALQRSQHGTVDDVPADLRGRLAEK
jgi:mono/diheme cytochrome c family protein